MEGCELGGNTVLLNSTINLTWNEWNCKVMIDRVAAVSSQVSYALFGYELGWFGLMIWVLLQQSTSESRPSEARQLFEPQKWLLWHWWS